MSDRGTERQEALEKAYALALAYLSGVDERHVGGRADATALREALGGPVPEDGTRAPQVLEELAAAAEPGLVASAGPRYFGFVIGGAVPAALGADWMTAAWDQDAGLYALGPAAAVVEDVCEAWLLDLLGLPEGSAAGFVSGGQMANFSCLAAARHKVLGRVGWDVEEQGLTGAPPIAILAGERAHVTIFNALKMLGLGTGSVTPVETDDQGRMSAAALEGALAAVEGPAIVCAQAGEVNTGSFDPFGPIVEACREAGAWLHVDGAFGLWAAASPKRAHLTEGVEGADSWAVDAHKTLNVPYDSGIAIVRDPEALTGAMSFTAAYLTKGAEGERDAGGTVPESSRRARGFPIYAAIRSLGRSGVAALVDGLCDNARRMADALEADPAVELLGEVEFNQVLLALDADGRDPDELTADVISRIRAEGTLWLGGTVWGGRPAIRVSFSSHATTPEDVDRSAAAIRTAIAAALAS